MATWRELYPNNYDDKTGEFKGTGGAENKDKSWNNRGGSSGGGTPAGIDGPVAGGSGDTKDVDGDAYQRGENQNNRGGEAGVRDAAGPSVKEQQQSERSRSKRSGRRRTKRRPSPNEMGAIIGGSDYQIPDYAKNDTSGPSRRQGAETADGRVGDAARRLEHQVLTQNKNLQKDDVRVVREGDRLKAETTEAGRQAQRDRAADELRQRAIDETAADSPDDVVVEWNGDKATARYSDEFRREQKAKQKRKRKTNPDESFGDVADIPIVGGVLNDAETAIRAASADHDKFVQGVADVSETVTANYAYSDPMATEFGGATKAEASDPNAKIDNTFSRTMEGATSGALQIGNVPGVAVGAIEGAEFVGWAANETARGRGGDALDETTAAADTAIDAGVDYAAKNPAKTAGMVAGSLVGSAGAMGGAARASSRAGTASRYAIQPGEEIITAGATRAAKRSARGRRALDKIPGGRIDNEEIAMAIAEGAGKRLKQGIDAANDRRVDGNPVSQFLADDRATLQSPIGRPASPETDTDPSPGGDGAPPDLLDDATTQYQDYLRDAARREADATRDLVDDVERVGRPTVGADDVGPTIDFDQLDAQRRARREAFDDGPARRRADAGDRSVDWSRMNAEIESEMERAESRTRARASELARADAATGPAVDVGVDVTPDFGLDERVDVGTDTELDVGQEFATDVETADVKLAREIERELELAQEIEREREREREGFGDDPTADVVGAGGAAFGDWQKTWSSGFASIHDVWGSGSSRRSR